GQRVYVDRRTFLSAAAASGAASLLNSPSSQAEGSISSRSAAPNPAARAVAQTGAGDTDEQRVDDLVLANHILWDQSVVDGFGHISVRSMKNPSHFFLSQSRAPALVSKEDILEFDENSDAVD